MNRDSDARAIAAGDRHRGVEAAADSRTEDRFQVGASESFRRLSEKFARAPVGARDAPILRHQEHADRRVVPCHLIRLT